jgi:uncharacterized membrane protein YesL
MNIFNFDSRLNRFLDKICEFLLLNFLWVLFCLPVFTIFPATAAMFGVVRSWLKKEEPGLTKMFLTLFKENFKQSFILGIVWTLIGLFFSFSLMIEFHMNGSIKLFLQPALIIICLIYFGTSIFLFPIMVNYQLNWIGIIKNSFLFSISQPLASFFSILLLACLAIAVFFIPVSFLALSSIVSYMIYHLCNRAFKKVEIKKKHKLYEGNINFNLRDKNKFT